MYVAPIGVGSTTVAVSTPHLPFVFGGWFKIGDKQLIACCPTHFPNVVIGVVDDAKVVQIQLIHVCAIEVADGDVPQLACKGT